MNLLIFSYKSFISFLCTFAPLRLNKIKFLLLLFVVNFSYASDSTQQLLCGALVEGIVVDLREPLFSDGVLTTEKGGVITANDLRIQARYIKYTRKMIDGIPICKIEAAGDLMLEIGDYIFVGESLSYDFQTMEGEIYQGRTSLGPWFLGGDIVALEADGTYTLTNGFVTTSENCRAEWQITSEFASLRDFRFLTAQKVQFSVGNFTPFWMNLLCFDLDTILESPFEYTAGWGGKQGPRVGIAYEIFSWNRWKTFLRVDYRLRRGPGAGFETRYRSEDHKEYFYTLNYVARDSSIFNSNEKVRYRFQGAYSNLLYDDKVSIDLTYDKMSDRYVPDDYADQSLEIETAGRTQLDIRRQENDWIVSLFAHLRVNNFETINQELPTIQTNWRPFVLGQTGIISENDVQGSYLDFEYAHNVPNVHDYNSARCAYEQRLYRPFHVGFANLTPELGSVSIFYGNSPQGNPKWLSLGKMGFDFNIPFHRYYDRRKHVIIPYAQYSYFTFPTVNPNNHYIFDIEDGWYRLNMMRFGFNQSYYKKDHLGNIHRYLFADIWANAFFDTETIPSTIPQAYSRLVWSPTSRIRHIADFAWDIDRSRIYHFNLRGEWTLSQYIAIAAEYRYRDPYDWRKVDRDNFILDSFRTVEELRHSALSDRRNVALLHFFYRFHPNWAVEFESRTGWHREDNTRFTEFEIDLIATLRSAANIKISYQHRESDDRIAIYFTVGLQRPDLLKPLDLIPSIEF